MQTLILAAAGLNTNPNPLNASDGSLIEAENVVIDRDDTIDQRRGFKSYGSTIDFFEIFNYRNKLFGMAVDGDHSHLYYDSDGAGTWLIVDSTVFRKPTGSDSIRTAESNQNLYILAKDGIRKLDAIGGTIVSAGIVKAIDGTATVSGVTGWFSNNSQVAYRMVWGKTDANKNKLIGPPSQRAIVANSSGSAANVALQFWIPSSITTADGYFYQIYRSEMSVSSTAEPSDELQLITEIKLTATDISNGYITYTDATAEALRGAYLYTNPGQEGILMGDEPPPIARDFAMYKQMMLYANTISKHRLLFTLSKIGATTGLQLDDTIVIDGLTLTAKASENVGSSQFKLTTGGTDTQNIDATAKSIIHVFNVHSFSRTSYMYYLSGSGDIPGKMMVEELAIGGSTIYATSSRGGAFTPVLPSSGTTFGSDNDTAINRIYISKQYEPEAVPLLSFFPVGSGNKNILRVIALRDSFFILKEDGIWRGTGDDPNTISITPFDVNLKLLCIDSAVTLSNQIFAYTNMGIVSVSDSGVSVLSQRFENDLFKIALLSNFGSVSFGVSYETDHKYVFFTVTAEADTFSTQQFVYNTITNRFTKWTKTAYRGIISDSDNKMYLTGDDSFVKQERKTYTNNDFADEEYSVQITGQSGLSIEVVSSSYAVVGYTLSDGTRSSIITEVPDSTHIIVTDYLTWNMGAAKVYKPITAKIKWAPQHGGNTAMVKHMTDVLIHFRDATFDSFQMKFNNDLSGYDEYVTVVPNFAGLWGNFPWGYASWGGKDIYLQTIRTLTPQNKSRGRWLNLEAIFNQALANFSVVGIAMNYADVSLRSK